MKATWVVHPLIELHLEKATEVDSSSSLSSLTAILIAEATRDLNLSRIAISTPNMSIEGSAIQDNPFIAAVFPNGLSMANAALNLLSEADMGVVSTNPGNGKKGPEVSADSVPARLDGRTVIILDQVLDEDGSMEKYASLFLDRGASRIKVACIYAGRRAIYRVEQAQIPWQVYALKEHEKAQ